MHKKPLLSIIVPVRNRPNEIGALLQSLSMSRPASLSTSGEYELFIIENGSISPADQQVANYRESLPVQYFCSDIEGRSQARNWGATLAKGEYLLFIDSDCEFSENFVNDTILFIKKNQPHFWGGRDRFKSTYTATEQAIGFTLSSFLTTGGVRGSLRRIAKFYPRGQNLGVQKELFFKAGGFQTVNGEDIEFGVRLLVMGYPAIYTPQLPIFHRPRGTLILFWKKIIEAGSSKASIFNLAHWRSLQWIYFLPSLLTCLGIFSIFCKPILKIEFAYLGLIALSCFLKTKNLKAAALSIPAALIQLFAYGIGFIYGFIKMAKS